MRAYNPISACYIQITAQCAPSEAALARWRDASLGIVFHFFALLPTMTLLNNVMLPMELAGMYTSAERRERAASLLEMVGLRDHLNKLPSRVSGGQQQRAAIARALADVARWKIETSNLNERNVVRFRIGSPAQITIDAIPDIILTGNVTTIQPRGIDQYGDITYTVTIAPNSWDERLRWNMSASVTIETP